MSTVGKACPRTNSRCRRREFGNGWRKSQNREFARANIPVVLLLILTLSTVQATVFTNSSGQSVSKAKTINVGHV